MVIKFICNIEVLTHAWKLLFETECGEIWQFHRLISVGWWVMAVNVCNLMDYQLGQVNGNFGRHRSRLKGQEFN